MPVIAIGLGAVVGLFAGILPFPLAGIALVVIVRGFFVQASRRVRTRAGRRRIRPSQMAQTG